MNHTISLINSDVKILAEVLGQRLNEVSTTDVRSDQTGFISGRSTFINLCRLFTNMQATHDAMGSRVVLALDTHMAFYSVEWPFIQMNSYASESFIITRGTRQYCPLSPLLFALAIEPLAELICSNSTIVGLVINGLEEKVSHAHLSS